MIRAREPDRHPPGVPHTGVRHAAPRMRERTDRRRTARRLVRRSAGAAVGRRVQGAVRNE
ncbi:hypothetical protein VK92_32850 [Burkholderia sp. LK4]|nr:hypothetical protein VL00_31545 [Burkholderia cepacia]KML44253.1 hypothetical protein VL13_05625 [Burkholderia lata]KMN52450.1 hypothetical protein VK92_32850 [Burkholderia sp. LK4]